MAAKKKTAATHPEQETDYRELFRSSKEVLFLISKKGDWIDFSDAAVDLFGFSSREDLAATKMSGRYARASDRKLHMSQIDKEGFVGDFPVQFTRRDGSAFCALVSATAIQDSRGAVTMYSGSIRDVPTIADGQNTPGLISGGTGNEEENLTRIADRLSQNETQFRSLFEAMEEGVALHEIICTREGSARDYRIIDVNPAYEMNTGLSRDKVRGTLASEAYGTGVAPYLDVYADVASTGKPASFETYFAPLDRHFHISVFSPRKGQFATVFMDISERRRREAEREEDHRKLQDQHTLFFGIIDSAASNIFSVDREYRYTSFNQQHAATMLALFGSRIAEGKSVLECISLETDRRTMKTNLDRALAGERFMDAGYTGDQALSRQYMEPSFNPIRDPAGEIVGVAVISRDSSERKKAEKALKASEERYRRLTENSRDIIFRLSLPERRFEYVSPACLTLTGYTAEEFYQNPLLMQDIIHPEFHERLKAQWERMPKGDVPREYEYRILHKSGEPRWFHQRNTLVRDSTGHVVALEGIVTDITDRKTIEVELGRIGERYRIISENTGDVIWMLDLKTMKFRFISPSVYRLIGYTPEEMQDVTLQQILTPESFAYVVESLPATLAAIRSGDENSRIRTVRLDNVRKDGTIVPVEIVATLLASGDSPNAEILGVSRDITEQKKAADAVRESEEKYRTLVETISDLVWEIDSEGIYTYVSPKVREMLGYEPEELIGKTPFSIMPPDESEIMMAEFGRLSESRLPVPALVNRCLHKDGSIVVMETSAVPIFTKDGRFSGYRGIDRDVTQKMLAQDALAESEERYRSFVESANEAIFVIQDGVIPFCNKKGLELIGYDVGYLATHSFVDLLHPDDRPAALERHGRRLKGEILDPRAELRVIDAGGRLHWLEIDAVVVPWDGKPASLNFATDITGRKTAETALRESERSYHGLFNTVGEAIYLIDLDGRFLNVNNGAVAMYGYPREFFIGKTPEALSAGGYNDLGNVRACMERAFRGEPQQFEFWGVRSNGEVFPKDVRLYKGSYFGRDVIIAVASDITERKRAEEAVRESEHHYHLLADNVSDVIWTAGKEMELTYISPSVQSLTGFTPEEFLKLRIEECLTPDSVVRLVESRDCILALLACDNPEGQKPQVLELEYRRKEGTTVWAEVVISLMRAADGSPQGVIGVTRDISERKRVQEALEESEQRFRVLLESVPSIAVQGYNPDHIVVYWNSANTRIYGYTEEEALGRDIRDLIIPPAARDEVTAAIARMVETGIPEPAAELMLLHKNGSSVPVLSSHAVIKIPGKRTILFCIDVDLTERKKAEEALITSEAYLKTIINSVQTGLVLIDPETHRIVDVNPAAERMISVDREKIIGSVCHNFICPAEIGSCPVTDHGYTVDNSERTLVTPGGPLSILKTVVPTVIAGKKYLLESFIDITGRKRAEERLAESEEKFHLIFKNSNDAIYLFEITPSGMPGRIVDANDVALLQTGQSREGLLKKTFLEIHSHELPQKSRSIMMELLTKGQVRFETEVARRDSSKLPVEVSAQFAKLNQKTYVIAISRDISRRKREERALRIANQKLQLMNIVAWHDIQNKVTGLRGYVELSKDFVADEQLRKFIQSEEEVLKVIHQQLQYTKEYQEMGVHPQEWVNLHQTLRMILSLAEVGSIQVVIDVGDLEIFCDPVIAKVFSHLIDNTKIHGKRATGIHISCREAPDGLALIYEDNGVGIPEEQKKELFMRNVGTTSGFSLFFIHDLLEVSEMTIRETGVYGEGVRFEIGIPRGIYRFGQKGPSS